MDFVLHKNSFDASSVIKTKILRTPDLFFYISNIIDAKADCTYNHQQHTRLQSESV